MLAFDHALILRTALSRLKAKVRYAPIGFDLLPQVFTIGQLHQLYEAVLQRPIDKRNFYRKTLLMGLLDEVVKAPSRAKLYKFNQRKYEKALEKGFHFDL